MSKPTSRRGRPPHPDTLTPGEWSVLHMLRHGLDNRAIARRRGTSVGAVKFHLANIAGKAGVRGRTLLRQWDVQPAGRRASTSAPSAAREDAMTAEHAGGPGSGTRIEGLGQISLFVQDVDRTVAFYRDTLGLTHLFTFGNFTFFDCAGVRLFLGLPEDGVWRPSSVLYFRVPDIETAHASLTASGVAFEAAPHLIHRHESGVEEWMAFFHDSEGNMLALMSQVEPST